MVFSRNTPHNCFNGALEHCLVEVNLSFDLGGRPSQIFLLFPLGCLYRNFNHSLRFGLHILMGLRQHFAGLLACLRQDILRVSLGRLNEAFCLTLRLENLLDHVAHDNTSTRFVAGSRLGNHTYRRAPPAKEPLH